MYMYTSEDMPQGLRYLRKGGSHMIEQILYNFPKLESHHYEQNFKNKSILSNEEQTLQSEKSKVLLKEMMRIKI